MESVIAERDGGRDADTDSERRGVCPVIRSAMTVMAEDAVTAGANRSGAGRPLNAWTRAREVAPGGRHEHRDHS